MAESGYTGNGEREQKIQKLKEKIDISPRLM